MNRLKLVGLGREHPVAHTNTVFDSDTVDYSCGLGVVGAFGITDTRRVYSSYLEDCPTNRIAGGTGFFIAAFINTHQCRRAYEVLCDRFPMTYQSPVRQNTNTFNDFFFCVFDREGKEKGLPVKGFPDDMVVG